MAKLKKAKKAAPVKAKKRKFAVPSTLAAEAALGSTKNGRFLTQREKEVAVRVLSGDANPEIKSMEERPLMRDAVIEALGNLGIDKIYLGQKLKDGLEATEVKYFAEKGVVQDERSVTAWGPRKAYLDTVLEIMGVKGQGAGGAQSNPSLPVDAVYKSHLGDEPQVISIKPPKDPTIIRRMQSQKPFNRRST